jgi:dTDP-4-amino-4,6-dideoxy-D-galactose acyltransferase
MVTFAAQAGPAVAEPNGSIMLTHERGVSFGSATLVPCPFETEALNLATFRLDLAVEDDAPMSPLITAVLQAAKPAGARLVACRRPERDRHILSSLQACGFRTIECLLTLGRDLTGRAEPTSGRVRLAKREDAQRVAAIAAAAFRTDRFHADPMVPNDAADRLKSAWACNSVTGRADAVFVIEEGDQIIAFNACMLRGDTAVIDLIAVKPGLQGRGLGRDLVRASLVHYAGKAARMTVGTQSANYASLALYQASGFRVEGSALTLHAHLD